VIAVAADELHALVRRVLAAAGADEEAAETVAGSLVASSVRGVDSHGFMRVPEYLDAIRDGRIAPAARPSVTRAEAVVRVAGNRAFGQLAAREATLAATEAAGAHGVAVALLDDVHHVGRLGEFVELAAGRGCAALLFVNGGPRGGIVAPFGGAGRALGTNPLAFALPAARRAPLVADFSTSAAAEGKIRLFREAGKPLPDGWLVDSLGRPSRDAGDLYAGGAILPAAGHKGFALGLLVEILGGVLAGAGCASAGDAPGNGFVLVALDVERLRPDGAFRAGVDRVADAVEATPPAQGFERVVVPGAPEEETRARRERDGIPVPPATWAAFVEAARSVGVAVDPREARPRYERGSESSRARTR
jgi:uncharacterized oxidoreductase